VVVVVSLVVVVVVVVVVVALVVVSLVVVAVEDESVPSAPLSARAPLMVSPVKRPAAARARTTSAPMRRRLMRLRLASRRARRSSGVSGYIGQTLFGHRGNG